jgi:hypothetical protein
VDFYSGLLDHRRTIYPCATLLRTGDLRRAGGYDGGRFGPAADLGAALTAGLARGYVAGTDSVVCRYTEHAANLTGTLKLREWERALGEVHLLITSGVRLSSARSAALDRAADRFLEYFVMDVAGKQALLGGNGFRASWEVAQRARSCVSAGPSLRSSLRIVAKLAYLRLRRAGQA